MAYHILYNPIAGNGTAAENAKKLSELYEGSISYHNMTQLGDYTDFFNSIDEDDSVVICGGDGTLNRFINTTQDIEIKNDILYFALGTGNDFLRDIGVNDSDKPFSIKKYITDLPCVEVKGKKYRFLNNVGFGIDGYCCEVGDTLKAKGKKNINYTMIAIKGLLLHYKPTNAAIIVDGQEFNYKKVWIAPTMKGRFYGGGMMPTPKQDRNSPEGELSLMVFYGKGKLKTLMAFPSIFKGEHILKTDMVAIHTGKEICVRFDRPSPLQIDGETILGVTEYKATACVVSLVAEN